MYVGLCIDGCVGLCTVVYDSVGVLRTVHGYESLGMGKEGYELLCMAM